MPDKPHISGVIYKNDLPVMDREQIDMLLMLDDEEDSTGLVRELFELFKNESAEKLKALESVCASGDAQGLRYMVHFVAGSAGSLGLTRLCQFYRAVEVAVATGELTDLSQCAAPIRSEFVYACEAFRKEMEV
jgi:HPt (histidine-containing phosphotransfer) domain-containing protein